MQQEGCQGIAAAQQHSQMQQLWSFYTTGYNGGRPWRELEKETNKAWRRGKRSRWESSRQSLMWESSQQRKGGDFVAS